METDNQSAKTLVILTTHFGIDFSGGSTATHQIFVRIQDRFKKIIVVCNKVGKHNFKKVEFLIYKNFMKAIWLLKGLDINNTIYYGDFYNSIWLAWTKKPFYFTFHDNWPEMREASLADLFRSFFYIPVYQTIFRQSKGIITVSRYKKNYISKYSEHVQLIYNGFNQEKVTVTAGIKNKQHILMVGNIEMRKYQHACRLFKILRHDFNGQIHIYGNILDKRLAKRLSAYHFVELKGFVPVIPYSGYQCLLHTSFIENLPIALCEAVYHRIPVIAFDVGGISEVVHSQNGILVDPFDLRKMEESLLAILRNGKKFSFNTNHLKNFDWEVASTKYLKLIG